jgi:ABC-type Fe3+ transport system substrate-binding protein
MTDLLAYASESRAETARAVLGAACRATGSSLRLELCGSTGSLYQRLGPRHSPPAPDIVLWFGPFAARSAGLDNLLQAYQPARAPDGIVHDPDWKWTTLDYATFAIGGVAPVSTWNELADVPRLALADPERSEVGLSVLLASLDRARQTESEVERGWTWWVERARAGLSLAENDAGALSMVNDGRASHALTLATTTAAQLSGLAPIPNAIGLAAASRNVDAARRLLDWLTSDAAAPYLNLSPWQAATNGLSALLQSAPALDVEWARQQYTATRRRWSQSGFGPNLDG